MKIIVVASFPRSGTHFTIDFLRNGFACCCARKRYLEPNAYVYADLDRRLQPDSVLIGRMERILDREGCLLVKTHKYANGDIFFNGDMPFFIPQLRAWFSSAEIHVISVRREPVATLRSYYDFSRRSLGYDGSLEDFLFKPLGAIELLLKHQRGWEAFADSAKIDVAYSQLLEQPQASLERFSCFLQLSASPDFTLPKAIRGHFQSKLSRLISTDPIATTILSGGPEASNRYQFSEDLIERIRDRLS